MFSLYFDYSWFKLFPTLVSREGLCLIASVPCHCIVHFTLRGRAVTNVLRTCSPSPSQRQLNILLFMSFIRPDLDLYYTKEQEYCPKPKNLYRMDTCIHVGTGPSVYASFLSEHFSSRASSKFDQVVGAKSFEGVFLSRKISRIQNSNS